MTDQLLKLIGEQYPLKELDVGEFSCLKANGMRFAVSAYHAEGLGHVSVMRAKGFFGWMKMDTLMIVPKERDLPLYSYDRICAMGNDTLIVELYDTVTAEVDLSSLDEVKEKFSYLPDRDPGEHWYDGIKRKESISKKGKKSESAELDRMTIEHFSALLGAPSRSTLELERKAEKSAMYVNGLLEKGGPSTDVFKKNLGEERTARLFRTVLFGIDS